MNESFNPDDDLFDRLDEPEQIHQVSINSQAKFANRSPQKPFDVFRYAQQVGSDVDDMGRQTRSPHQGFDGYDLSRASLQALGTLIQTGAAIAKSLEDRNQQKRVESALERVVELDDRINNLTPDQTIDKAKSKTPKPIPAPQKRNAAAQAPIPPDQTLDGVFNPVLQQIDQQLDNLDRQAGISSDRPLIAIDPSLSINQKLDLIEQALNHLSDRVERLEQFFSTQQVGEAEKEQPEDSIGESVSSPTSTIQSSDIAQSLYSFAKARSKYLGELPNYSDLNPAPIKTSLGTLIVSGDEDNRTISIKTTDETKFDAAYVKDKDKWIETANNLSRQESEFLLKLPRSVYGYDNWNANRDFISELSKSYPEVFNQESDSFKWETDDFHYTVNISNPNSDKSQDFTIKESSPLASETVVFGKIVPGFGVQIDHSDIASSVLKEKAKSLQSERSLNTKREPQIEP